MGSKWSLSALRSYFKENGLDFTKTWDKIKDIVIKSVLSVTDEAIEMLDGLGVGKNNNTLFELYGFDVLIDDKLEPWLIEINLNPSLNCDTELDLKVKSCLLTDIFNIIGLTPYSHVKSMYKSAKEPLTLSEYQSIKQIEGRNDEMEVDGCVDKTNGTGVDENISNIININDIILYSLDEFSRSKTFNRLFPAGENVDYYSKFLNNPGEENLELWKYLKSEMTKDGKNCSMHVNNVPQGEESKIACDDVKLFNEEDYV
jgi:tubulin polyglutamylase TTLL5